MLSWIPIIPDKKKKVYTVGLVGRHNIILHVAACGLGDRKPQCVSEFEIRDYWIFAISGAKY